MTDINDLAIKFKYNVIRFYFVLILLLDFKQCYSILQAFKMTKIHPRSSACKQSDAQTINSTHIHHYFTTHGAKVCTQESVEKIDNPTYRFFG